MGAFGCMGHALVRDEGSVLDYLPSIVLLSFKKCSRNLSNLLKACLEFMYI